MILSKPNDPLCTPIRLPLLHSMLLQSGLNQDTISGLVTEYNIPNLTDSCDLQLVAIEPTINWTS